MPTLYCHPNTLELLKKQIEFGNVPEKVMLHPAFMLGGMGIRTDPYMKETTLTGKYVLPDGSVVTKENVFWATRWITYGPEDISWLLYSGVVKYHREITVYIMEDPKPLELIGLSHSNMFEQDEIKCKSFTRWFS